jgi:hypothetical protein
MEMKMKELSTTELGCVFGGTTSINPNEMSEENATQPTNPLNDVPGGTGSWSGMNPLNSYPAFGAPAGNP